MEITARPPAVAGAFYEADPLRLRSTVTGMLASAAVLEMSVDPKMMIVPHAGYIYSGAVAATGYRSLSALAAPPSRVAVVGPSHFALFEGVALPMHRAMATPLGPVPLDRASDRLVVAGHAGRSEEAHRREHSIEVQLPFLQVVLSDFSVIPLLTGDHDPGPVRHCIDILMDDGVFVVISSDLSHYHDVGTAKRLDGVTSEAIVGMRPEDLGRDAACGRTAVQGALMSARRRGWHCQEVDRRTSADTAGDPDRVVGYGTWLLGPVA